MQKTFSNTDWVHDNSSVWSSKSLIDTLVLGPKCFTIFLNGLYSVLSDQLYSVDKICVDANASILWT